jgi:hypothetical protein
LLLDRVCCHNRLGQVTNRSLVAVPMCLRQRDGQIKQPIDRRNQRIAAGLGDLLNEAQQLLGAAARRLGPLSWVARPAERRLCGRGVL